MVDPEKHIFPDEDALADFALSVWEAAARASTGTGKFTVALSGGKTPVLLYRKLASRPDLPWRETIVFFADERLVPGDHPWSNFRLARETLLEKISLPPGNVHPAATGKGSPEAAAENYEIILRRHFGETGKTAPVFDLVLLGLGEDGHTASLFPGSRLLQEETRWAAAEVSPAITPPRITLTLPIINRAAGVLFLVSGRNKAEVLKRVVEDRDPALPASLVRPVSGRLIFAVDRYAAQCLRVHDRL